MTQVPRLLDSFKEILKDQVPNFLRLYPNPYVAQTCLCLARYVQTTWGAGLDEPEEYQSFLANAFDEALSGAIKLARYSASVAARSTAVVVFDPTDRLGPFVGATAGDNWVQFLPGITVINRGDPDYAKLTTNGPFGIIIMVASDLSALEKQGDMIRGIVRRDATLVITCIDRMSLADLRRGIPSIVREFAPDITIFDESFVESALPFAAMTARKTLYNLWNQPGKTTFHSTTFQPNTISSLHFMRCLVAADPEFHASLVKDLDKIAADLRLCCVALGRLYSPSLARMIRTTGFAVADIRAAGDFILVNGRQVLDGVSGVACSIRGHNPSTYVEEMENLDGVTDCRVQVEAHLRRLTGMDHVLPAVSGANAVETALRLALVAQFPKRHILALKSGFGGKTLLALAGTANPAYKEHIDPLYADVHYVDPFAPDAEARIESVLEKHAVAVVQLELIQAVGGVRRVPESVVRYLECRKQHWGYLLLVDEVQTGMYRTGPFSLARDMGLSPDFLLLGKGTSDMMYPFALALYSAAVQEKLDKAGSDIANTIGRRYDYELGFKTALNVLRRAEEMHLAEKVASAGALFARLLKDGLAGCDIVREVRVFGLLIGIELDVSRWPRKRFRKRLFWFYVYSMLRHRRYPVLIGFCQYEPHVLKITPALTVAPAEIEAVCATVVEVLKRPFHKLLVAALGGLIGLLSVWRRKHEHDKHPATASGGR